MESKEALPERLTSQLRFYESRAQSHWRVYRNVKFVQLVFSSAIPIASFVISDPWWVKCVSIVLGSTIAGIESFRQMYNADRHWRRWRLTAEALKREQALYLEHVGDYAGDNARTKLAQNVEDVIEKEQREWIALEESNGRQGSPRSRR